MKCYLCSGEMKEKLVTRKGSYYLLEDVPAIVMFKNYSKSQKIK